MSKKLQMIRPEQVVEAAKRKKKENRRFRSFLKNKANPLELDHQFMRLHKKIFSHYDCSKCRNCCKLFHAEIPEADIDRDAAWLGISREDFISEYLEQGNFGEWTEKHLPCGFLNTDGNCKLGDCRPDSCKKFPYTDQPERLFSLYSVLNAVEVCPAAYEILEALKKEYNFSLRQNGNHRSTISAEDGTDFSFIAGYTSWGFPYGTLREADNSETENQADFTDLPF